MTAKEHAVPETSAEQNRSTNEEHVRQGEKAGRLQFETGLRWFLAAVLVWAGLSKLVDPVSFYGAMLEYQLPLPHVLLKITAVVLPWMELFCGLLLLAGIAPRATLIWVTALFGVFLLAVGQAFLRGLDISCGCFDLGLFGIEDGSELGHALESAGVATLRNLVLLGAAIFLFHTAADRNAYPPESE
ncbi:MAG: putative oxidoreductase [Verrucomicrobiales bacterium]|jgi:putative oxidoreductase